MRKKVIVLGGFALVLVTALLVRWFSHPSEPHASGRSFTYWFRELASFPQDPAADHAIRVMGTNCLPFLLARLSCPPTNPPTFVQKKMADLVENKVPWLRRPLLWNQWRPLSWDEWERACGRAFWLLGPAAERAIPELERLLEDPAAGGVAARVLANRGTNAWPSLMRALASPSPHARIHTLQALQVLDSKAIAAVPQVVVCLQSSNKTERYFAAHILGRIHQQPEIAVPALTAALDDADEEVQGRAAIALTRFPEQEMPAIPKLKHLQNSADAGLSNSLAYALKALNQLPSSPQPNQGDVPARANSP